MLKASQRQHTPTSACTNLLRLPQLLETILRNQHRSLRLMLRWHGSYRFQDEAHACLTLKPTYYIISTPIAEMERKMSELARRLWEARLTGGVVAFGDGEVPRDLDAAYELQWQATHHAGRDIVGWKIGSTNAPVQKKMGTNGPIYGPLFAEFVQASPGAADLFVTHDCHIETEIAFFLGADLPPRAEPYDVGDVASAVEAVCPAFELVGSRVDGGTAKSRAVTLIPDFAGQMGFVYGEHVLEWQQLDLSTERARIYVNGDLKAEGTGKEALGNPLNVLAWLANALPNVEGAELKRGQYVSTGTLTGLTKVVPGDQCAAQFDHLGGVRFTFSGAAQPRQVD